MGTYHDDNFGAWEGMDPHDPDYEDNLEFYKNVQKTNVRKKCQGCGQMVNIQPHYAYCNSCADTIERGGELPGCDDDGASADLPPRENSEEFYREEEI